MDRGDRTSTAGLTGTTWLTAVVATSAFAVLITFGWIVPRIEDRYAADTEPPAVTVDVGTTGTGAGSVELDPAGPTIAGPPRSDSRAWVIPELVIPLVLATLWGTVLAWALWFRPHADHQAEQLAVQDHRLNDLVADLESATTAARERERWVRKVEEDLVRVRGEMASLERELQSRVEMPPGEPRRRSTDPPLRRRDDPGPDPA